MVLKPPGAAQTPKMADFQITKPQSPKPQSAAGVSLQRLVSPIAAASVSATSCCDPAPARVYLGIAGSNRVLWFAINGTPNPMNL